MVEIEPDFPPADPALAVLEIIGGMVGPDEGKPSRKRPRRPAVRREVVPMDEIDRVFLPEVEKVGAHFCDVEKMLDARCFPRDEEAVHHDAVELFDEILLVAIDGV